MYDCLELDQYDNNPCAETKVNKVTALVILLNGANILDIQNNLQWLNALQSKDAIIIKDADGTYDGGSPTIEKGYGEQYQRVVGNAHKMTINLPYVNSNVDFLNNLMRVRNKGIAFVTGAGSARVMHFVPVECTFSSKMPVTDDMSKERQLMVEVSWSKITLPLPYNVPTSFDTVAPDSPIAAEETSVTSTSFVANWAASSGASDYLLDVSTSQSFASFVSGYEGRVVSGVSQSVTGLTTATTYYYRVRSRNFIGSSQTSNVITAITS